MGCMSSRRYGESGCLYPFLAGSLRFGANYVPRDVKTVRFICDTRVPRFLLSSDVRVESEIINTPGGSMLLEWVLPSRSCANLRHGIPEDQQPRPADFSRIMVYMHGGAYILCQPGSLRGCTSPIARTSGMALCVPDYRRPPETPIPGGIQDGLSAYQHLLQAYPDAEILLGGESAGGALAASMLSELRCSNLPMPCAAFLMSPWTDIGGNGADTGLRHTTLGDHNSIDYLPPDMVAWIACQARGQLDGNTTPASPMYVDGSLEKLPPLFVLYGLAEVLCGQIEQFCNVWAAKGARIERCAVTRGLHAPILFNFCHTPSRNCLEQMNRFFNELSIA